MEDKLINIMREHPYLYDKADGRYRNKILKEKQWKEISEELNYPVKTRWRSLRDRFKKEHKRTQLPSGIKAVDNIYWKHYDALMFLSDFSYQRRTESNFSDELVHVSDRQTAERNWEDFIIEDTLDFDLMPENSTPMENLDTARSKGSSSCTPMDDLTFSSSSSQRNSNSLGRKYKSGLQQDVFLKEMSAKFSDFLDNAQCLTGKKEQLTPIQLFFQSIAKQVESSNVDFETWCEIQSDVINILKSKLRKTQN